MCFQSRLRQELCVKVGGGRPGFPVRNSLYGLCGRKATLNKCVEDFRLDWVSCVKVEVAVLGSPHTPQHRFPAPSSKLCQI